ncbi:MAG: hypothetical protein HHJ16_00105 [Polaromonas sp.]|uniref:hypothetical protein n=1 Tax=Polaromonas sp. TaxID=1869339 RepID=UPI0018276BB3|nr:hypothetical protein [Polaromonas sp.]NMM08666.1 hypothetical protein [Polaromonas sp.]
MRALLMRVVGIGTIFLLVWLVVVIYWQNTSRLPSESELVLYLGVVPLVLVGAGWGVMKLVSQPQAGPAAPSDATKQTEDLRKHNAEQEREWTLNIVASSLQTSAGTSSSEVLSKLQAGDIDFELDPELKNSEGFPVFSARIAELEDSETRAVIAEWQKTSMQPDLQWSESQYRALHLAALSTNELASLASEHPDVQRCLKQKEEGRLKKDDTVLPLRLIGLWPRQWSEAHQSMASAWLKSLIVQYGWPEHRILVQKAKTEQANPISLLDEINVSAHRMQLPTIGILVASDSGIQQEYVDALAAKNNLFGGKNTQGSRPGEAAAGLLFADAEQSKMLGTGQCSSLHRASWASREKSADEKGRVSADLLGSLVGLAVEISKVEVSKIQLISADNDHRPSRESELAEMVTKTFPDLDAAKDALKAAQACGSLPQITTVAALCIAHQYVINEQLPVLCASLHDPLLRAAVVLRVPFEIDIKDKSDTAKAA